MMLGAVHARSWGVKLNDVPVSNVFWEGGGKLSLLVTEEKPGDL